MNKKCILILISTLIFDIGYGQSQSNLIESVDEQKVLSIQNQKKIDILQRDFDELKVRFILLETELSMLEKEITRLTELINRNHNQVVNFKDNDLTVSNSKDIDTTVDIVLTNVQIKANFPGGEAAFRSYLDGEFVYPERCLGKGIIGSVMLRFVVDEAGRISCVHAIEETNSCPEFTTEAIRILKKSPRWVPGQNDGTFVKSWRVIPIRISPN